MKKAAKSVTAYLTGSVPQTDVMRTVDPHGETRRRILEYLAVHGPSGVSTLAEGLDLAPSELNDVLEEMRDQGLIITKSIRNESVAALASHEL